MTSVTVLFVFMVGLVMGLYLGDGAGESGAAKRAAVVRSDGFISDDAHEHYEQNVIFAKRIRELEDELATRRAGGADALADRLALIKKYPTIFTNFQSYDNLLRVTPEVAELLQMTPDEIKAVEGHLKQTRDEVKKMLESNVTMVKQTPTQVNFQIAPLPNGAQIQSQFADQLASDIGPDRAEAFMKLGAWQNNATLYGFGVFPINIQIISPDASSAVPNSYRIKTNFVNGSGYDSFMNSLPPEYQGIIPFEFSPPSSK